MFQELDLETYMKEGFTRNHLYVLWYFARYHASTDEAGKIRQVLELYLQDRKIMGDFYEEMFDHYCYCVGERGSKGYFFGVNKYTDELSYLVMDEKYPHLVLITSLNKEVLPYIGKTKKMNLR